MQALISRGYLREAPAAASRAPTIVCTGPRRSSGLPNADVKDDEADGTNGHIAVIHFATSNGSLWPRLPVRCGTWELPFVVAPARPTASVGRRRLESTHSGRRPS